MLSILLETAPAISEILRTNGLHLARSHLKLQPALARRIGHGLDTPVVQITATVEDHRLDALFLGPLGNQLADLLGRRDVASGDVLLAVAILALLEGAGRDNRRLLGVVDQLYIDVVDRTVDVQPGARRGSGQLLANAGVNLLAQLVLRSLRQHFLLSFAPALIPGGMPGTGPSQRTNARQGCADARRILVRRAPTLWTARPPASPLGCSVMPQPEFVYFEPVLPTFFFSFSPA